MATLARTQTVAVQRPRFRFRISRIVFLAIAVFWTLVALTPFILTVSGSFKTKSEILDWPPTIIPHVDEWMNYVEVWTNSRFMTQFFKSLPKELEEAASIDGASVFRTFRSIILPNAYPALAALAILRFQGEWNAFQWPLIVVRSPQNLTLPLGLASFQGLYGVNWNWVLAGAMFNAVPIIILVIFFQKYFIRSAASSAVKG